MGASLLANRPCPSLAALSKPQQVCYTLPGMRSTALPPLRVEPEVETVSREAKPFTLRLMQSEFVARGEAAIQRWKRDGDGRTVDEVMAALQRRLDDAKHHAQRLLA